MGKAAVILAAGMGTRMKSVTPKVLHKIAGKPILGHVIAAARGAGATKIVVVTSPDGQAVRDYAAKEGADAVIQEQQLGTGHAANCAASALKDFAGVVAVTYGDMPLLTLKTFEASYEAQKTAGMAIVAFEAKDPSAYGRVILDRDGMLDRIVEFKDANDRERAVTLCNAGLLAADAKLFFKWAANLKNDNAQKEYYLTDIPLLARADRVACAVARTDEEEVMGVNSRAELAQAEAAMQRRLRNAALASGVGMTAPETVYFSYDTVLESDVLVEPFVVFAPGVTVRSGAQIKAFSHLESAEVGQGALVGPYARLRPGAVIEEDVHIGNFVEVKKARIEKGAKANHLSYIGDARVGAGANIGAGTITCNYDGYSKFFTDIGANAFIGSNSSLVAPVSIGDGAYVASGSVITESVPEDALAFGRARQKTLPGKAKELRERRASAAKK